MVIVLLANGFEEIEALTPVDMLRRSGLTVKTVGLDGLLGRAHDVDEALVGAALELLAAVLVFMDGAEDRDDLGLGRQGDGAGDLRIGALGGLDDGLGGLVDQLMVVSLEADADHVFVVCHGVFLLFSYVFRRHWDRL